MGPKRPRKYEASERQQPQQRQDQGTSQSFHSQPQPYAYSQAPEYSRGPSNSYGHYYVAAYGYNSPDWYHQYGPQSYEAQPWQVYAPPMYGAYPQAYSYENQPAYPYAYGDVANAQMHYNGGPASGVPLQQRLSAPLNHHSHTDLLQQTSEPIANGHRQWVNSRFSNRPRAYQPGASMQKRNISTRSRTPRVGTPESRDAKPTKQYLNQTINLPEAFPVDCDPPKPLPLLVLDLNGTLVFRHKKSASYSTSPTLRPYLRCFLKYCLGDKRQQTPSIDEQRAMWDDWSQKRTAVEKTTGEVKSSRSSPNQSSLSPQPPPPPPTFHGSHFWSDSSSEPVAPSNASYRVILWSSAQPKNVDAMARAILSPQEAQELLRVYARDTLVEDRYYFQKVSCVKDFNIIWAPLNNASRADEAQHKQAESRLFAEYRKKEKRREDVSEELQKLSLAGVELASIDAETGKVIDGKGYGPHNSLLLDDTTLKAAMQPYNHILVPEFDAKRASRSKRAMRSASVVTDATTESEQGGKASTSDDAERPDDVLLQTIGVLEHARFQQNVSSWIRFGGLGELGGVQHLHPSIQSGSLGVAKDVSQAWIEQFNEKVGGNDDDENDAPRLRTQIKDRTQDFWCEEGRRALRKRGIEVKE